MTIVTGWDDGLCQDYSKGLAKWFSTRLDACHVVRQLYKELEMKQPIKAGDMCVVVNGLLGQESPNIGLVVIVKMYVGDEITLGRIWRCEAEFGERIQPRANIPMGLVDFAQDWLRKVEPPKLKTEIKEALEMGA